MATILSYLGDKYLQVWDSSPLFIVKDYQGESKLAKAVVECFKWSARAVTLGVFSGGALCAAFSLGASTTTIQVLTGTTAGLFGASAVVLLLPLVKMVFLGAIGGAFCGGLGMSFIRAESFPAYLAILPYAGLIIGSMASLGAVALSIGKIPSLIKAGRVVREVVCKDYNNYLLRMV